jgi:hypothetical protein
MLAIFRRNFLVWVAMALIPTAVAVFIFLWFFGLPIEARYWGRKMPILRETPVPLRVIAVTDSPGKKMAFCGTEFEIPWSDLNGSKTKSGSNSTVLFFDSGLAVVMKCEPPREFVDGVLDSIHVNREIFRRVFGNPAVESDYALTQLILGTTPDSVSVFRAHRYQGPMMSLLLLKAMGTPAADTGIFSIHTSEFDGFQYQDPAATPGMIVMNLFSVDRGLEFQFHRKYEGALVHASQADINRIVQTLHKVGPYSPLEQASIAGPRAQK